MDEDDKELADEDEDECEGRENLDMGPCFGFASNLGDLSMNGSLGGELKSRQTVDSRKPMPDCGQGE